VIETAKVLRKLRTLMKEKSSTNLNASATFKNALEAEEENKRTQWKKETYRQDGR